MIGGDGVQQPRALPQAARRAAPTRAPSTISGRTSRLHGRCRPVGGRVDVVGDAVLVDLPGDALLRLGQVLRAAARWTRRTPPTAGAARRRRRAVRRSARRARRSPASSGKLRHGWRSQVERVGKLQAPLRTAGADAPGRVGEPRESREPPALGLVAVHREAYRSCVRRDASRDTGSRATDRSIQVSTMSNVSGAWTGIVG